MPIVIIVGLLLVAIPSADVEADVKYLMPRELVEHARVLGCLQIEDFFDLAGMIGPPYVYGYLPGHIEDSAAFWCEKNQDGTRRFFLAVVEGKRAQKNTLGCPRLIAWHNRPGGLTIYRDPEETLEGFRYIDAPTEKAPPGRHVIHNAIQSSRPGQSTTFYCDEGRWLVRSQH